MASTAPGSAIGLRITKQLAERLGPTKFGLWFNETARIGVDDATVRVQVPSQFHADWITRHFQNDLKEVAARSAGRELKIEVEVTPDVFKPAARRVDGGTSSPVGASPPGTSPNGDVVTAAHPHGANPASSNGHVTPSARQGRRGLRRWEKRYDLDRFVVGPSNRMAYLAASEVSRGEKHYNPLFIHGACGVGKTHLLQGVCRRYQLMHPDARIRYATGEQFTNDYITAVRSNSLEKFRDKVRGLDLLAVDDVHFLSDKLATQNEFLCTFDAIVMSGAHVVLTCDDHPRQIRQFHTRLISRFVSGMVVEIELPDRETRRCLIEQIASRRGLRLSRAAVDSLVDRCVGSVREIEGSLTKLQAMQMITRGDAAKSKTRWRTDGVDRSGDQDDHGSSVKGGGLDDVATTADDNGQEHGRNGRAHDNGDMGGEDEVGLILVRSMVQDESNRHPAQRVRVDQILPAVADRFRIDVGQILGPSRHRQIVAARSICAWLARRMTSFSYPEIARAMNRKNHSTIVAAVKRIQKDIDGGRILICADGEPEIAIQDAIDQIRTAISSGQQWGR